jgi:tol-pal system protein YbgF
LIPINRTRKRLLLSVLTAAAMSATAPALAAAGGMPSPFAPAPAMGTPDQAPRLRVAQSQEAAQLQLQIQQLQEQIRVLTGQVEGLQFQVTQMQTQMERTNEDNEFRFQALEGGEPGKSQAATESGGAMPAEELPQSPAETEAATASPDESRLEPGDGAPMDVIGETLDPMVGNGAADGTLGTLSDGGAPNVLDPAQPLNLSLDGGAAVSNGDAQAQYDAGYDAVVRGDYAFAEDQFQQFVALYPDDPQAPDATHWLGEALIQRGAYDDAALVLAEGYQQYQNSSRAPDLLLKLGVALNGAGEAEVACRTYATLEQRHAEVSDAFRQRLADEKQRAQCPG